MDPTIKPSEISKPLNLLPSRRPRRVLHLLEATLGGTLHYLDDVIQVFPRDSFEAALAYSSLRADPNLQYVLDKARSAGWRLFPLDMRRALSLSHDADAARRLRKILHEYRPDILHCHSSKAGAVGRLACLGLTPRPRVIYSPHAIAASLGRRYLLAERLLSPLADRFAAVSDGERKEIVEYGLAPEERVDVIHPLIDHEVYRPRDRNAARAGLSLPRDGHIVVAVGRLTTQKDPLLFLEVIRQIAAEKQPLTAIWLGDGELRDIVNEQIVQLGLEGIVILSGWQSDVGAYLAAADLLLTTSRYESFGYMVAEALAMERPVVASDIPGTRDILTGRLGELLYPAGNAQIAARMALHVLNNPDWGHSMGQLGRASIKEHFSADRMRSALIQAYSKLT